jgi:hypothetical protein
LWWCDGFSFGAVAQEGVAMKEKRAKQNALRKRGNR